MVKPSSSCRPRVPAAWKPTSSTVLRGFGSASFKWCSTRPPVAIPLDEMTIAGMRDCVSCFDSALDSMARNRVVQNVHTRRSCSAWARRFGCGSCAFSS